MSLFSEMGLTGMKPDVVSFIGVTSACANQTALKQGKEIHGLAVRKHVHAHLFVANSLLDFYNVDELTQLGHSLMEYYDIRLWNAR